MPAADACEMNLTPLTKPFDHLGGSAEPRVERPERVNQIEIKIAPKPFGSVATVVPKHREHTAEPSRVFNQSVAPAACVRFREVQSVGVEQRAVLNVQRELEKRGARTQRTKHLRRTVSVSNGLVIAKAGIVRVPCRLEDRRCVSVPQQ